MSSFGISRGWWPIDNSVVLFTSMLVIGCERVPQPNLPSKTPTIGVLSDRVSSFTNTSGLGHLVGVINRGTYVEPHACITSAQLRLIYEDGQDIRVGLYSGHEPRHMEFSVDGRAYSVPRTSFLDAALESGFQSEGLKWLHQTADAAPAETPKR